VQDPLHPLFGRTFRVIRQGERRQPMKVPKPIEEWRIIAAMLA